MPRQLTEKQQALLNVLFEEAGGDMIQAKKLAGYADTSSTAEIVKGLKKRYLRRLKCTWHVMRQRRRWR